VRPRLLDLFCGAGGAAMGYHRAGFEVVGVDLHLQPHYPFEFHQGDALTWPLDGFDAIHASPPCQHYSALTYATKSRDNHPDLVAAVRSRLSQSPPWVIENVPRSPLLNPLQLCGTMFGLRVLRHRWFEANFPLPPMYCAHLGKVSDGTYVGHRDGGKVLPGRIRPPLWSAAEKRAAVGIDWMPMKAMRQAIPPAYTEFIGRALLAELGVSLSA
jgi:DNA (cytosine-5)-methyltransferase 1